MTTTINPSISDSLSLPPSGRPMQFAGWERRRLLQAAHVGLSVDHFAVAILIFRPSRIRQSARNAIFCLTDALHYAKRARAKYCTRCMFSRSKITIRDADSLHRKEK